MERAWGENREGGKKGERGGRKEEKENRGEEEGKRRREKGKERKGRREKRGGAGERIKGRREKKTPHTGNQTRDSLQVNALTIALTLHIVSYRNSGNFQSHVIFVAIQKN